MECLSGTGRKLPLIFDTRAIIVGQHGKRHQQQQQQQLERAWPKLKNSRSDRALPAGIHYRIRMTFQAARNEISSFDLQSITSKIRPVKI